MKEAMKIKNHRLFLAVFLVFLAAGLLVTSDAGAQSTRLRRGDRLELAVPQRQELGRELVIDERGQVQIPLIGDVTIAGLLLSEAEGLILGRLKDIYPSVNSVTLTLTGEVARRQVYVHGAVLEPGKYEFEISPSIWEAVREAGGALPTATLEAVRVIRAESGGRRTFIVNLQQAIETGDLESLPLLKPGDTVIVPEAAAQYAGSGSVKVMGAVLRPGSYMLGDDKKLVDAVLSAGGPLNNADLKNLRIIRRLPEGATLTMQIDFSKYLENGDSRQNPLILPDDTVNLPRSGNFFSSIFRDPGVLVGMITATATLLAVLTR